MSLRKRTIGEKSNVKPGDSIWEQTEESTQGPTIGFDKQPQSMVQPKDVGTAEEVGQEGVAKADHLHRGVALILVNGVVLRGEIELIDGTNALFTASEDDRTITLDIGTQGWVDAITRVTEDYSATSKDTVILADTDEQDITVTLPEGVDGQHLRLVNCGSSGNTLTIKGYDGELVVNAETQARDDEEVLELHFESSKGWY